MARFLDIPPSQLEPSTLRALLEEFASRDGTDYGSVETPLAHRVSSLETQLVQRRLHLLFDQSTETWDLVGADDAKPLLALEDCDESGDA